MLHRLPLKFTSKLVALKMPLHFPLIVEGKPSLDLIKRSYSTPRYFRTMLSPLVPTASRQPIEVSPTTITPVSSLFRDLDEMFFRSSPFLNPSDVLSFMRRDWDTWTNEDDENQARRKKRFLPGYDIASTDTSVKIFIDLPGVKMEDISIEVENDKLLRIRGERKMVVKKKGEEETKSEIQFEKSFSLDTSFDSSKIVANLTDGVLTVTIPKISIQAEEKTVRKIEVKTGSQDLEC